MNRDMTGALVANAAKFRVIAIMGPRQAGKTTLAKAAFPNHAYVSFEDPETRAYFASDPRTFLEKDYGAGIILDEFQHVPEILSYIQGIVDRERKPGYFVLTGSHNYLAQQAITQSLAGRVVIHTLLPLSCQETKSAGKAAASISVAVLRGNYPEVIEHDLDPNVFAANYINTYVMRDVKQLVNIKDTLLFQKFIRLCAARIGQTLNMTNLADECGINTRSVESWLSLLEASYILFRLPPYFKNFNKQVTKSPKLYFYDTSLACHLLRIHSADALDVSSYKGALVESFVIADLKKQFLNYDRTEYLYFGETAEGGKSTAWLTEAPSLFLSRLRQARHSIPAFQIISSIGVSWQTWTLVVAGSSMQETMIWQ